MDVERAESQFRILQAQREAGELDEDTYRVQVAELLWRDQNGIFWMLDADRGTWFCNRGEHWEPGDPREEQISQAETDHKAGRRRGRLVALAATLLALLAVAGIMVLWRGRVETPWNSYPPTPIPETRVGVTIASPAAGSQIALGQEIAIESTVSASPDLQSVDRVMLRVNGQRVDVRSVPTQVRLQQSSFPLSQPWRPQTAGEYQIEVTALSEEDEVLGTAGISLEVTEEAGESPPEQACVPNATFVADVTILPGTVFPPGVRIDKVWQVRNSGSCAWGVGYELALLAGREMIAPDTAPVPPTAAGAAVDLSVTLWAPAEAGIYTQTWQMRSPSGGFFGPTLPLAIQVEILAQEDSPPSAPGDLTATVGQGDVSTAAASTRPRQPLAIRLTWSDRSANEDAFRVYRADLEASIGLAPSDTELFVDEEVVCGNTYLYSVVAFNAVGASAASNSVEVTLPPCAPVDTPPALDLTIVPTQVRASETFTLIFQANDDQNLNMVVVWGVETQDPALDSGRIFTCTETLCTGVWPLTWTQPTSVPLTLVAVALDSSGQRSEPAWLTFSILPPEMVTPNISITE
jgi:hypothetical protein